MNPFEWVNALLHGEIIQAPALPFKRSTFYADMFLITTLGNTQIISRGFDLPGGEEVFFLDLAEYKSETYWHDNQGRAAWPPSSDEPSQWNAVDLVPEIAQCAPQILASDRRVRFYRSPEASLQGLTPLNALQSAAAVNLASRASVDKQLIIFATPEFPCSLEISMDVSRINAILAGLEEFHLDQTRQAT